MKNIRTTRSKNTEAPAWFAGAIAEALKPVHKKLEDIDMRLEGIDKRLEYIDMRLNDLEKRVGTLEKQVTALDGRVTALSTRIDEFGRQLTSSTQSISDCFEAYATKEDLIKWNARLNNIGKTLGGHETRIVALEGES